MGRSRDIAKFLSSTEAENTDNNALLHTGSSVGVDSAQVKNIGIASYDTLDSLPMSGLVAGQQAFVDSARRLYISNGSGWFNVAVANATPQWDSGGEPDASYEIADSATPLVITARAIDSDNSNINLLNQSFGTDSAQYMVDISNDSSVFTFTPKSADSIGIEVGSGNLTDSNGDFIYTFKWSDGINFVSKAVTISYNPTGGAAVWYGDRAVVFGGSNSNEIQYYNIATPGNASDFGDLTYNTNRNAAISDASRGLLCSMPPIYGSRIEYVTISTTGNSTLFGTLINGQDYTGAVSDASRGVIGSKYNSGAMEYVTIQTTGNGAVFGNLDPTQGFGNNGMGNGSDGTYGIFAGKGGVQDLENSIQRITIQTLGDGSDFGQLSVRRDLYSNQKVSDQTRTVFAGGYTNANNNTIDYITTATPGNATDFGDTIAAVRSVGGTSNGTTGVYSGGYSTITSNVLQSITIQTTGNATDFGDLATAKGEAPATSGNAA